MQRLLDFQPEPLESKRAAEKALAVAIDLARRNDPTADAAFAQAEALAIKAADMEIQACVFECSGDFYRRSGALKTAAEKYRIALQNAECNAVISDAAVESEDRLRYKLLSLQNRDEAKFKIFEGVVQPVDPYQARLSAWFGYRDDTDRPAGRLAARGLGSKEDFRRRLDAARSDPADDEDDG